MSDNTYGGPGCSCWADPEVQSHNGQTEIRWYPNAGCRHHGILAPWIPPRVDTGTYRLDLSGGSDLGRHYNARTESYQENFCACGRGWPCPDGRLNDEGDAVNETTEEERPCRSASQPRTKTKITDWLRARLLRR